MIRFWWPWPNISRSPLVQGHNNYEVGGGIISSENYLYDFAWNEWNNLEGPYTEKEKQWNVIGVEVHDLSSEEYGPMNDQALSV